MRRNLACKCEFFQPIEVRQLSTKSLRVCLFCLGPISSETPCRTMAKLKFCKHADVYRPCAKHLLGFMSIRVVVTKNDIFQKVTYMYAYSVEAKESISRRGQGLCY